MTKGIDGNRIERRSKESAAIKRQMVRERASIVLNGIALDREDACKLEACRGAAPRARYVRQLIRAQYAALLRDGRVVPIDDPNWYWNRATDAPSAPQGTPADMDTRPYAAGEPEPLPGEAETETLTDTETLTEPRYCVDCGTEITADVTTCQHCGAAQDNGADSGGAFNPGGRD